MWFSVSEKMLSDEDFIKSKPSDKLYYFSLLHYINLHEMSYDIDFFKRDVDFAAALGYSEDTIRNARRKFQKLGWIDVTSGFITKKGQNVATTYHYVKWKDVYNIESERFVKFPHYDFEMMLQLIHQGQINHNEMVVYCYVVCWQQLKGALGNEFYISKKELRKQTNIIKAVDCIEQIAQIPVFSGDSPVFKYKDEYHRILITELNTAADPFQNEGNYNNFKNYLNNNKKRAEGMIKEKREKELKKAMEKGEIIDESQLIDLFQNEYKKIYGKKADISCFQKDNLIRLAKNNGIEEVTKAIKKYFVVPDKVIPNPSQAKTKTLARFVSNYNLIIKYE